MGEGTTGTNPTLSAILRQSLAALAATDGRPRQASVMKDVLSGQLEKANPTVSTVHTAASRCPPV